MSRCVIIGGAKIRDYERARRYLRPDDFAVYCDCGLDHMEGLGLAPGLIVGDFDSHPAPDLAAETITLPREKDDTDTVYAVKEALRRGYEDFLLLGAIGGRLDHTLANIQLLILLAWGRGPWRWTTTASFPLSPGRRHTCRTGTPISPC